MFALGVFTCTVSLQRGIITEEDRPLNACATHSRQHIRFEVVINTQTENSCRDQDETPERHSSMAPQHPRRLDFLGAFSARITCGFDVLAASMYFVLNSAAAETLWSG